MCGHRREVEGKTLQEKKFDLLTADEICDTMNKSGKAVRDIISEDDELEMYLNS